MCGIICFVRSINNLKGTKMIKRDDIPLGYTYDANGNVLTCKDSAGYWYEYTRDAMGNELTYTNETGKWITLVEINNYTLRTQSGKYWAGCRRFDNAEQALKHWDRDDDRACLFTIAIGIWEGGK
jgi:hypothetical protein